MNKGHWSHCATNKEPAYPAGPCDCGGLDLAAYERYRRVTSLIPDPGSLAAFMIDEAAARLIEPEQLPSGPFSADASAADLPSAHDGVAVFRGPNSVDLNDA